MKEGFIQKSAGVGSEELTQINRFTRREFTADELYVFSVVLCDNEVDRDFEQFTPQALEKLGELFIGKPGLFDHEPKATLQTARIFSTAVKTVEGKQNTCGEPYVQLTARAYLPRTQENQALITEIESGIKKEVSVGCAVKKRVCSICGKEDGCCRHTRGEHYAGKLCYFKLEDPADAYEWSFVAVPAQRAAGVTKQFAGKTGIGGESMTLETLKSMKPDGITLTAQEIERLQKEIGSLEELAEGGRKLREEQIRSVIRSAAVLYPGIPAAVLQKSLSVLNAEELAQVADASRRAAHPAPQPQLAAAEKTAQNKEFFI